MAITTTLSLGIFHFQNILVEPFHLVLQAFNFFLVDCEKVRGIFLPYLAAHEIGDEESAQVVKRVNGSWRQLLNHELADL